MGPVHPKCPRCAYDLGGVVDAWSSTQPHACPLTGTCSECGQEFAWGDVFFPHRRRLPGFVEHARGPFSFLVRSCVTLVWVLLPWMLWKRVKVTVRPRPGKAALWLLVFPLILHGLTAAYANAVRAATMLPSRGFSFNRWFVWASDDWTSPFFLVWYNSNPIAVVRWEMLIDNWPPEILALVVATIAMPVIFLGVMRVSRARVGVHSGHVARAMCYGMVWIHALFVIRVMDAIVFSAEAFAAMLTNDYGPGYDAAAYERLPVTYWIRYQGPVVLALGPGWFLVYWWQTIRRGWGFRRSGIVFALTSIASVLAGIVTVVLVRPDSLVRML